MTVTDLRVEYMKEVGAWPPLHIYSDSKTTTPEEYVTWLEERIIKQRLKILQLEFDSEEKEFIEVEDSEPVKYLDL